jgi:membrane fusion protein (multidrug efflux system)
MKTSVFSVLAFLFLVACSKPGTTDKKAQLIILKRQQKELSEKISALEKDLALTDTTQQDKIKIVAVTPMAPDTFVHYIEVQAKVEGEQDVIVSAESMGNVTAVLVNPGDRVSKGQVLATLDDRIIRQSMLEVESQVTLARTLYERQKNLWDQKIGSEVQYLNAKTNKEALEKRMASVREQWDLTRIKSPINGTVDESRIKEGQALSPGYPAFRVVNLSELKVRGEIADAFIGKVKDGNPCIIYFPDSRQEVRTRLSYSGQVINPLNRTFNVEVRLDRKDGTFHPNQVAILKIADYASPASFVLPVEAVQKSSDGEFVYVAEEENGKKVARRKTVTSGLIYNGRTEITSGLAEGDAVITTGFQSVIEGDRVQL